MSNYQEFILPHPFLESFTLARLRLRAEAKYSIKLPKYSGSAFRGVFGRSLREVACVARRTSCSQCPLVGRCVYPSVFLVQADHTLPFYKKVSDPPRPFVLEPPNLKEVALGQSFELGLTIFGRATEQAPWLIQAFLKAGQKGLRPGRGQYRLFRAENLTSCRPVIEEGKLVGEVEVERATDFSLPTLKDRVQLEFETPVRLKREGRLTDSLSFVTLVRHLLRRVAQLGAYYCGSILETDFRYWIHLSEKVAEAENELQWRDWVRRSSRQKSLMKLGGLVGRISYQGEIKPFTSLLALGQITHVGKGTTFGLGRYRILEE